MSKPAKGSKPSSKKKPRWSAAKKAQAKAAKNRRGPKGAGAVSDKPAQRRQDDRRRGGEDRPKKARWRDRPDKAEAARRGEIARGRHRSEAGVDHERPRWKRVHDAANDQGWDERREGRGRRHRPGEGKGRRFEQPRSGRPDRGDRPGRSYRSDAEGRDSYGERRGFKGKRGQRFDRRPQRDGGRGVDGQGFDSRREDVRGDQRASFRRDEFRSDNRRDGFRDERRRGFGDDRRSDNRRGYGGSRRDGGPRQWDRRDDRRDARRGERRSPGADRFRDDAPVTSEVEGLDVTQPQDLAHAGRGAAPKAQSPQEHASAHETSRGDATSDATTAHAATSAAAPKTTDEESPLRAPVAEGENGFAALGVPAELVERLARDGITQPFSIQAATIPDALAGKDVLGRGRTGSGKTLSFGLPVLARLAGGHAKPQQPRAVIMVPTRELAMQVSDALQPLVHVLGLRHKLVAGGMPYPPQLMALERGVDLLVATPGRLIDLMERGAADLSQVEICVLDEADHMSEMGFMEPITTILDAVPRDGQTLLFSATLDHGIDELVERYLTDPTTHSTDEATASVTTMAHHVLLVEPKHKKPVTALVANREGRTVVFCRTKLGADRVASQLRESGVMAAALHGGLHQGARNKVLSAFKDGRVPVLVATDVAARGIHVDDVSVVLQVDPPADHKDYLHRAGRTARAGEEGAVISLVLPHQRKTLRRLLDAAGVDAEPVRVAPGDQTLVDVAGTQELSGDAIGEAALRQALNPPRRGRGGGRPGGPGRGRKGFGQRGFSRGHGHRGGGPRRGNDRRGGGQRRD